MTWRLGLPGVARWVSSCLLVAAVSACSGQSGRVTLARPLPQGSRVDALSTGYSGTATFDAPVVDPNTWTGSPAGTGSYALQSNPAVSGGPHAIGALDSSSGAPVQYASSPTSLPAPATSSPWSPSSS